MEGEDKARGKEGGVRKRTETGRGWDFASTIELQEQGP